MNILERFSIDEIRRLVAVQLGVNPEQLSVQMRSLRLSPKELSIDGISAFANVSTAIVPISFSHFGNIVTFGADESLLEILLAARRLGCTSTTCTVDNRRLVNFSQVKMPNQILYEFENLADPFGSSANEIIKYATSSFVFINSPFQVMTGPIELSLVYMPTIACEGVFETVFNYLEFSLT